jgi:hypothetical protein
MDQQDAVGQTETKPPRRRRLAVAGVIVVAMLAGLIALGALTKVDPIGSTTAASTLFHEEFASEESAAKSGFSLDKDRSVDLRVTDGVYRVTFKETAHPQIIRHLFERTYEGIAFEATVAVPADGLASVGCWSGGSSYLLLMTSEGETGLLETVNEFEPTVERRPLGDLTPPSAGYRPGTPSRLRIECVGGGTGPTLLSGYVDGELVHSERVDDGLDAFDAVGFFVGAERRGVQIEFDDATASIAERPSSAATEEVAAR